MRRVAAALTCVTVVFGLLYALPATVAADTRSQGAATASPTPSGTGESPSPSPSGPSESPSPSPSPSSETTSPSPTSTPTDGAGSSSREVEIEIVARPSFRLFELGDQLNYELVVSNVGTHHLSDVIVANEVPTELDVAGVPIVEDADAINLHTRGRREEITWTINEFEMGETVSLPWQASVASPGDLVAENEAVVIGLESSAAASKSVYLATSSSPEVHRGVTTAARPTTETKRVVRYEQRRVPVSAGPAALPQTGGDMWGWALLAVILLGLGLVLARARASRLRLCAVAGLLVMTACIGSETPPPSGTGEQTSPEDPSEPGPSNEGETEDRVLGTRIQRGDDQPAASGDAEPPAPEEPPAGGAIGSQEEFRVISVPVVRVVRVPAAPAEEVLQSLQGENVVTFSWDEATRSIRQAASSRLLSNQPSASLLAELRTDTGTIAPAVELANFTESSLIVRGELGVTTLGDDGAERVSTSRHVDLVLAPGAGLSLEFEYVLPSGDYSAVPFFRAD